MPVSRVNQISWRMRHGKKRGMAAGKRKYKKKLFKRRKTFKRRKGPSVRSQRLLTLCKSLPDQAYLDVRTDLITVTGTSSTGAVQQIWAVNSNPNQGGGVAQIAQVNLALPNRDVQANILGAQASATYTQQYILKDCHVSAEVRNTGTGPCVLWEYRCRARKDLSGSGTASIGTIIISGFSDSNVTAGAAPIAATPIVASLYGATLFQNPRFVRCVKVLKVKKFDIMPGRAKKFSYSQKFPRLIKQEDQMIGAVVTTDGKTPSTRQLLKGDTFSVFCLAGTFALDTGLAAGFKFGVGNAQVGIIYRYSCHYALIQASGMTSTGASGAVGFSPGADGYPLPIVANQPYSTINETTGVRVLGTTYPTTILDTTQTAP